MSADASPSEHLHKLALVKSEQQLESLIQLLWQSRKTGLSAAEKSSLQTLLQLPSISDLDPVLPSLRSLIRKVVHEGGDIMKHLPLDVPLELQSMLPSLLQKHRIQWREELSQDQATSGQAILSYQNADISAPLLSFPPLEVSRPLLPQQVNPISQLHTHDLAASTPLQSERNRLCLPQLTLQNDCVPPEFLGVLPRVKSMNWTVVNRGATIANRVAIISLKLQDYTLSPSREMEVKFQLTKDTLDAVLRSMAYINEQLSRYAGSSSEPLLKKQRQ